MSTKGSPHCFDPTRMLESILGEAEMEFKRSIELMHRRFDRIENESLKRRGFTQSNYYKVSNHEFRTLKEDMDRYNALCAYERYKHTCDEYEEGQRSLHRTSRPRSSSSKRDSSKECRNNRIMELKNSRVESTPHEPKNDFRSQTKK